MTATELRTPEPASASAPSARLAVTSLRLSWLYLVSRRVPAATGLIAALGVVLWAALHWHWSIVGGAAARQVVFLVIETGTAAVIAVTAHGPFGEPERATGRWLPYLRLGAAMLLAAAAVGTLAAGAAGGQLPGGTEAMARNLTGMTGIGLLSAAVLGGAFGWAGPMAYLLVTEGALAGRWTTPWIWPARPPADLGGALCAYGVFAAGIVVLTLLGPRDASRTQPAT